MNPKEFNTVIEMPGIQKAVKVTGLSMPAPIGQQPKEPTATPPDKTTNNPSPKTTVAVALEKALNQASPSHPPKPNQRRTGVEAPPPPYEATPGGVDAPPANYVETDEDYTKK